jgi:hypothetical protein
MANVAWTSITRLVRRLAALRLTAYSSIINGITGEIAKKLRPKEKLRNTTNPPITNR